MESFPGALVLEKDAVAIGWSVSEVERLMNLSFLFLFSPNFFFFLETQNLSFFL